MYTNEFLNNSYGLNNHGVSYEKGIGIKKNYSKANIEN